MPPFRSITGMTWKLTGVITSRSQPTILVHEWVTGGGMAGRRAAAVLGRRGTRHAPGGRAGIRRAE